MQQVRYVPLLPVHNQFACLEVENEKPPLPSLPASLPCKVTQNPILTVQPWLQLWPQERHLLKCYVIATTPGPKSLTIKVEIQTTDTAEIKARPALIDCGATGQFMDQDYMECNFKSSDLSSQDHTEVNLYRIAARYVVMVVNKKMWESWHDSHAVTIQWVHVIVDPLLST